MADDENTEPWLCQDCGYTETDVPVDEVTGETEVQTFGSGAREVEREVVVCPECGSDEWHSRSVGEALLGWDCFE